MHWKCAAATCVDQVPTSRRIVSCTEALQVHTNFLTFYFFIFICIVNLLQKMCFNSMVELADLFVSSLFFLLHCKNKEQEACIDIIQKMEGEVSCFLLIFHSCFDR